jgi:acyl carrier protein
MAVQVLDDVKMIISKQIPVPLDQLSSETRLEAIGIESLDVIEIIYALEDKYKIAIPFNANESATVAFETIGEVAKAVQELLAKKDSA